MQLRMRWERSVERVDTEIGFCEKGVLVVERWPPNSWRILWRIC